MSAWLDRVDRLATSRAVCALQARFARGGVRQGPRGASAIALTFDDGPDPEWTPRVLDVLAAHRARATFFVVGRLAVAHADLVRRAAAEGHEIGMHLFSHTRGVTSDDARFSAELAESISALAEILGHAPRWLRFPYGDRGTQSPRALGAKGVDVAHWTFSSHDSFEPRPREVVERVRRLLRPGAIVLLHDCMADWETTDGKYRRERDVTVAALPTIVELARRRSLELVTLSALMGPPRSS